MLTGAGVSAESGIATFRDEGGLWARHRIEDVATPEAFARDPARVQAFYDARRRALAGVEPNAAHRALARLASEFAGAVFLITQNVDDLHERGGSNQVCHMHGELTSMLCRSCGARQGANGDYDATTACPACGAPGGLRPDIVWFGEIPYHMDRIGAELGACDLFIAIGTSGSVYPAAGFVREARMHGAFTIEVNLDASDVSGYFDRQCIGPASVEVPALVDSLLA